MDILIEVFENPAYRHVLLNHIPITGLGFSWLALAWAVYDRRWPTIVFALSLVLVTSGCVLLVISAGDDAYARVFNELDGHGRAWLDHHTLLADRWGHTMTANAVLAGLAIAAGFYRENLRTIVGIVVLVTTVGALAAAVVIAEAGGKLRHTEFRLEDPPVYDVPGRIR
jgi:hypothetical protein